MTEHTLNSSQGDPEKVDYDKLIYIQNLKKSLRDIGTSSDESYKQQMTKYNPFAGKEDGGDNEDKKDNETSESKTSKLFW